MAELLENGESSAGLAAAAGMGGAGAGGTHPAGGGGGGGAPAPAWAISERVAAIEDVPLAIDVELDRRNMSIREILGLGTGSVLKMGRSAGENIDIRVGGALVGFGEIVILEETIGVRITDFNNED